MRIVVVDFAAEKGGALSILKDFSERAKLYKEVEWIFILSDYFIKSSDNIQVIIQEKKKINRISFDLFLGRKIINDLKPDLVFNMQNTYVYGLKSPQILYVHQAIPFQTQKNFSFFEPKERKYAVIQYFLGFIIKLGLPRAKKIIVQTNWMKKSILKDKKIKDNDVIIISPSIENEILNNYNVDKVNFQNFFYPTSNVFYKMNEFLINTFLKLEDIISRKNKDYKLEITLDDKFNHENLHIEYLGEIDRKQVLEKMKNSVIVFPSIIEAFGMPLLEAKSIGSVIFAARTDFSQEILENYANAYFFEMNNEQELLELLTHSISNKISYKNVKNENENENKDNWKELIEILISEL